MIPSTLLCFRFLSILNRSRLKSTKAKTSIKLYSSRIGHMKCLCCYNLIEGIIIFTNMCFILLGKTQTFSMHKLLQKNRQTIIRHIEMLVFPTFLVFGAFSNPEMAQLVMWCSDEISLNSLLPKPQVWDIFNFIINAEEQFTHGDNVQGLSVVISYESLLT